MSYSIVYLKIMDKEIYVNPWLGVIPYKITDTTPELSEIIDGK